MNGFISQLFSLKIVALFNKLTRERWFWTYSITPDGELARTLVNSIGCNHYLAPAPKTLPIYQIAEFPDINE